MKKPANPPWPTKDAMAQVYENNLWGGGTLPFYSGDGSHDAQTVTPYVQEVRSFLQGHNPALTVCDLGCGDFNIGKQLVDAAGSYTAVDIVPELIAFNRERFKQDTLSFEVLDIAQDPLPSGDCVMLRQVLQHLSNREIAAIVEKLYAYRYVMLTEHLPDTDFTPNIDIISGQGIRLKRNSGVDLLAAPFNFKVKAQRTLLNLPVPGTKGRLVTVLYTVF